MTLEVLVSTMFRENLNFLSNMNISTPCVVINQTDTEGKSIQKNLHGKRIVYVNSLNRGLSNSRNAALDNATEDISIIADDDIYYLDGYDRCIVEAYNKFKEADIIIFDYITDSIKRKCNSIGPEGKILSFIDLLKVSSVRITFKTEKIKSNNIRFNTLFGSGSVFPSGEENLFLKECYKKGLKIYYVPKTICKVDFSESTWFKGFSPEYFESKGAFSIAMFGNYNFLYIIQFLVRKYKLYKHEISFFEAFKACIKGKNKYLREINGQK